MGWDITYHPIAEDEVRSIYFAGIEDPLFYKTLQQRFSVDAFYAEQLRIRFDEARKIDEGVSFARGHAYYVAVICGFLRQHHYIRGGGFSFLLKDQLMMRYTGDWKLLVPDRLRHLHFDNQLTQNYCGGVYLPHESLKRLRGDYHREPKVRAQMDDVFSHGRLRIFWQALDAAISTGLGLIEASEVVEPSPFNLKESRSLSNLYNCHPDGALLYAEAAAQQLGEALQENRDTLPFKTSNVISRLFRK